MSESVTVTSPAPAPISESPEAAVSDNDAIASRLREIEEAEAKAIEAAKAKFTKQREKLAEEAAQVALSNVLGLLATEEKSMYEGLFETLEVDVPATGIELFRHITVKTATDGSLMITVENIDRQRPKGITGTRAPRGSGTGSGANRLAFNADSVTGFTGEYTLADGKVTKSAAAVLKSKGIDPTGDSAPRLIVAEVRKNPAKFADVKVKIGDALMSLDSIVASRFPVTATATTETAPASS